MKAVLCPVCAGSGKYKEQQCHGCHGRGWVMVPEDRPVVLKPFPPFHHKSHPPAHSLVR
jgi:DnaJ-class molecular chaperone